MAANLEAAFTPVRLSRTAGVVSMPRAVSLAAQVGSLAIPADSWGIRAVLADTRASVVMVVALADMVAADIADRFAILVQLKRIFKVGNFGEV